MAVNKAKRSIHLAQPERRRPNPNSNLSPQPAAELMPVKTHVYRTIAELNQGFEKVLHDLHMLARISFFRTGAVTDVHRTMSRLRAELNQEFTLTLHGRETANANTRKRKPKIPKSDRLVRLPELRRGGRTALQAVKRVSDRSALALVFERRAEVDLVTPWLKPERKDQLSRP